MCSQPIDRIINDCPLPPRSIRKCGRVFRQDRYWLESGQKEVDRLIHRCQLRDGHRLLDVGCGAGRLALGLKNARWKGAYCGVDVDYRAILWCERHLASEVYAFVHLPIHNRRYSPTARLTMDHLDFRLPFETGSFDVIYAYSVFTHMKPKEVDAYLREFPRLLHADGTIFLTAFAEPNVPEYEENPPGYPAARQNSSHGPMHRARYNVDYLLRRVAACELRCAAFDHQAEWDKQSALYLKHTER